MKKAPKIIAIAALLIACYTTSFAQLSLGLRGGLNVGNVYTTDGLDAVTPDFQSINGPTVAGVLEYGFSKNFALQTELGITRKGFKFGLDRDINLFNIPVPVGATAESRFNYLEVPLLAKIKFGDETVHGYVTAGPTFGYATSGRLITRADALFEFKVSDTDINLDAINYERFEVGGAVGAGIGFNTGFGQLFADARYTRGFTELYDIPVFDERIRNQGFALSVGFLVPLSNNRTVYP
ncbi:MAG: porin family protein [Saprospiraceae bacterium]